MQDAKPRHPKEEEFLDAEDVRDQVDQDPGERQKENQNDQEDDPLAA